MENRSIYEDIAVRTEGDIYIGVVGPVRTGKSTFIKSFMETMVLPRIDNVYLRERAKDELPQSGSGRTIMTAEPKFVPEDAVDIIAGREHPFQCAHDRLCGLYDRRRPGAAGRRRAPHGIHPLVRPRSIPAGSGGDRHPEGHHRALHHRHCGHDRRHHFRASPGRSTSPAEERVVQELQTAATSPLCVLLNSVEPGGARDPEAPGAQLEEKYGVSCLAVNCAQLSQSDIEQVLRTVLYEFPAKEFRYTLPSWVNALETRQRHPPARSMTPSTSCTGAHRPHAGCAERHGRAQRVRIHQRFRAHLHEPWARAPWSFRVHGGRFPLLQHPVGPQRHRDPGPGGFLAPAVRAVLHPGGVRPHPQRLGPGAADRAMAS